MDYKTYCCPKCNLKKHLSINEKFDFKCKICGETMKYEGVVRNSNCNKESFNNTSYHSASPSDNTPKCPKCGCTNIQIVRRNWSFFAGFATNKTDRVCVNCNYKW